MKINFRLIAILFLLLFCISLIWLSRVYAFLTVAFVLAYLLDPIVERLEKKRVPRACGSLITIVFFFILLISAMVALVPRLVGQIRELATKLPEFYANVGGRFGGAAEQWLGFNPFQEVDKLILSFGEPGQLVKPIGGIVGGVVTHTFQFVTTILGLLIIPLMAYYLMREYPKLYGKVLEYVPRRHHKSLTEIRDRLRLVLGGFLRGQLVVSTILSMYYITALALLGLNLSLLLGLMAGFFNVIPYLGILTSLAVTLLVALVHGSPLAIFVGILIVYAVGMAAEGSFLTPRIVGRKVGLGPLTLIVSLLIGGELLGLVGMLIAVPIAAIAKVLITFVFEHYRVLDS